MLTAAILLLSWVEPAPHTIDNIFQVVSALGTCGFNAARLSNWAMSPLFLLAALMLLGGNSSSTAGGIKTERIAWFTKGLWRGIKQVWLPEDQVPVIQYNGEQKETQVANRNILQASVILFLWLATLSAGTLGMSLLTGDQYDFHQVLFDTASALNNVGLSAGVVGAGLSEEAKLLLATLMWVGRLEIMAVAILLLSPLYLIRRRV